MLPAWSRNVGEWSVWMLLSTQRLRFGTFPSAAPTGVFNVWRWFVASGVMVTSSDC